MSDSSDAPLPHNHSIRRSLTLPTKLNPVLQRRSPDPFKPSENDIFYHPSARVVHFSPRALAPIPSSTSPSDFDYPVDTVGTLPWRSPTERTVAFAALRLEKVYGSTVFLKCGSVVHAILKNSQCWCVDGESTFVLRIRPLTYYRIELPSETEEEKTLIVQMKEALPKILRYEVTPCPFKRGFTVEIPEEARTPRRKKAWRPKSRRESAPISSAHCLDTSHEKGVATPDTLSAGEDTDGNATDDSGLTTKGSDSTILETIPDDTELPEPLPIPVPIELPRRSVSETQQSFQTLLARFDHAPEDTPNSQGDEELPLSSSVESFHSLAPSLSPSSTFKSFSTSTSPVSTDSAPQIQNEKRKTLESSKEPTFSDVDFSGTRTSPHVERDDELLAPMERDLSLASQSKLPIVAAPPGSNHMNPPKPAGQNPHLTSMSAEFRRRSRASREREMSPMPPASTLVLAAPEKNDAASLIHKTCTLVLVPPIQLLIVLIHIAARIVIGPAVNTTIGDLDRKFECQVSDPRDAMDDYDLPLAPDYTRKASVSEKAGYPDPWDLD